MSTVEEVKTVLRQEMDARGWHDADRRAGLAAIVGGESGFLPKWETGYSHTSNARIREIFPSRVRDLSDAALNQIKSTEKGWFNFVYGGRYGNRPDTDDGYDFRGGGLNQLTFRDNYERYGKLAGVDLIANPELINVPRVAAAVAVEYMKDRFKGGNFNDMKRAVGVSIGGPDAEKNRLYELYSRTHEWDYDPASPATPADEELPSPDEGLDPIITVFLESLQNAEKFLKSKGLYTGPIDNDPGPGLRAALKAYLSNR